MAGLQLRNARLMLAYPRPQGGDHAQAFHDLGNVAGVRRLATEAIKRLK